MRFCLALLPLVLFAACDSADPEPGAADLLTANVWVPRSADTVPVSSPAQYAFREDGTLLLTFDDGTTEEESWTLEEDGTELVVRDGGASRRFSILQLTADALALEEIPAVEGAEPRRYELVHP